MTYSPGNGGTGLYVEDETNVGVGTTLTNGQKLFVAKIDDDLIGIATVELVWEQLELLLELLHLSEIFNLVL